MSDPAAPVFFLVLAVLIAIEANRQILAARRDTARWHSIAKARTASAPPDQVTEGLLRVVEKVRFDKAMIGDGFEVERVCSIHRQGQPVVWIVVTTMKPAGVKV